MSQTERPTGDTDQTRLMKALSHPLRWRILETLGEGPASPAMIATELGEPLGNVSYHVKILLQHDAVELVETRAVRGALEHVYRAAGGLGDERSQIGWTTLELDQEAYDELTERLSELVKRAGELQAESADRARADGSRPLHRTELTLLHYDRVDGD
jgi:DNA-binding transcriptional ArsR family regulator